MRTSIGVVLSVGAVAAVVVVIAILVWPDSLESVSAENQKKVMQSAASTALPTSVSGPK